MHTRNFGGKVGGSNAPQYFFYLRIFLARDEEGQIKKWGQERVGERVICILRIGSNQTSLSF